MDSTEFELLCSRMIEELAPQGPIEETMAGHVLSAFERVRRGLQARAMGIEGAARCLKAILRSFRSAQECFDLSRTITGHAPGSATSPPPSPSAEPPSPPVEPPSQDDSLERNKADEEVDAIEEAARNWRAHIAMVPSIDARWPVVDRLGLSVDVLLELRDHGFADDEILDCNPGLTYSDLAACYACEADGFRGPLEPPYPENFAVIEDTDETEANADPEND